MCFIILAAWNLHGISKSVGLAQLQQVAFIHFRILAAWNMEYAALLLCHNINISFGIPWLRSGNNHSYKNHVGSLHSDMEKKNSKIEQMNVIKI